MSVEATTPLPTPYMPAAAPSVHSAQQFASLRGDWDKDRPPGHEINSGSGTESLTFADLLDVVNPLHHIPVVGDLYREMTGDSISPQAKIAGGGLYGGPIGLATSVAAVAYEEISGASPLQSIASLFNSETETNIPSAQTMLASAANSAQDIVPVTENDNIVLASAGPAKSVTGMAASADQTTNQAAGALSSFMADIPRIAASSGQAAEIARNPAQTSQSSQGPLEIRATHPFAVSGPMKSTQPVPQTASAPTTSQPDLSPEAMDAIFRSFGQTGDQAAAPSQAREPVQSQPTPVAQPVEMAMPAIPQDPLKAMEEALAKYQQMKMEEAKASTRPLG